MKMTSFYILIILFISCYAQTAFALDIEYGNIISIKNPNVIIEYKNIEKTKKFLCNLNSLNCNPTKSKYFSKPDTFITKTEKSIKINFSTFIPDPNVLTYIDDNYIVPDDNTLYYIGNTKDNSYLWNLYRYNITTKESTIIESNVSSVDTLKQIGRNIIFHREQEKGYGPETYNLDTSKLGFFKVPNINTKKLQNLSNVKVVKIPSASNSLLNGIIMAPNKIDAKKKYPLVIWLHGGPQRQASLLYHPYHSYGTYDSILDLLRKDNVIILKLNYRGSLGLGEAYAQSIVGSIGKGDVDDVIDSLSYMEKNYNIDKTYLMGNSYGGYLSLKTLVEHPDLFTGVVSINGVTDWESLLVRMQTSIFNSDFNGLPNILNRNLYDQASIIDKIGNLGNQKISIIAGKADRTIPFWQATMLYDKLRFANKNVTLTQYVGEDHVYKRQKTITKLCKSMFSFVGIKVDPACNN